MQTVTISACVTFRSVCVSICNSVAAGTLVALLAAGSSASADSGAPRHSLEFDVLLGNKPIGLHRFDITAGPGQSRLINSEASFDVRILGITAYRYRHRALERWEDGCLRELEATTDDNGDRLRIAAVPAAGALQLTGSGGVATLPGCTRTYAYWDRSALEQARLLNPQTGQLDPVSFTRVGTERIVVQGREVAAERHRLATGKFTMDLWYSTDGQWLQLDSTTQNGRRLRYRLRTNAKVGT